MIFIRVLLCILLWSFVTFHAYAQPEYRVKSISFTANSPSGFQAGKPFTVTYVYQNNGTVTGTNVQIIAYYQIDELGLKQDLLFDAQSIPSFPAGAEATVSFTVTSQTSATYNFGGTINKAVNVGNIRINIPAGPEGDTSNNTRRETVNIFCAGSILTINDLIVTEERPIVADEIVIGDSSILSGGKATVQGGETVVLLNGFRANQGSNTRIQIGDCSTGAQKLVNNIKQELTYPRSTTADGTVQIQEMAYQGVMLVEATIHPNPVQDILNVSLRGTTSGIKALRLYNNLTMVREKSKVANVKGLNASLSLQGLSAGIYIVEIILDNGNSITKKVIKV